jgi:hypothetical protein
MHVFERLRERMRQVSKKNLTVDLTHDNFVFMRQTKSNQRAGHLVVLDIENLAGTASPTPTELEQVKTQLAEVIDGYEDLQCIVACGHRAAPVVMFAFPRALRRLQSGPNGADLTLLSEMGEHRIMDRYEKVTLCSGDGIFTDEVARLGRAGVDVTVVAIEGSLASRLRLAASHVVTLTPQFELELAVTMKVAS